MEKLKLFLFLSLSGLLFSQEAVVPAADLTPTTAAASVPVQFKVIVDAGHGGKDGGTVGGRGLKEKDIVLEIAGILAKMLVDDPDKKFKVILTRAEDKFVTLEDRIAFANQSEGDFFISIHANASESKKDSGFEAYYNSLVVDDALIDITKRENAGAVDKKDPQPTDSMFILWELAQNEFQKESMDFADKIQSGVETAVAAPSENGKKYSMRNRGVKQAAFAVLRGVRMPAVLIESSYLSNDSDELNLSKVEFKERIAKGLYSGIKLFAGKLEKQKEVTK